MIYDLVIKNGRVISVWEGWKTKGKVEKTFSRCRLIVDGDSFTGRADHGKYLHRMITS